MTELAATKKKPRRKKKKPGRKKNPRNTMYQKLLARARVEGAEALLSVLTNAFFAAYGTTPEGALLFQRLIRPAQKERDRFSYAYQVLLGEISTTEAKRLLETI